MLNYFDLETVEAEAVTKRFEFSGRCKRWGFFVSHDFIIQVTAYAWRLWQKDAVTKGFEFSGRCTR